MNPNIWLNMATVLGYVSLFALHICGVNYLQDNTKIVVSTYVQIFSLFFAHTVFQFYMLGRSQEFSQVTKSWLKSGKLNPLHVVVGITLFLSGIFYIFKMTEENSFFLVQVLFYLGLWHSISQTKGLYFVERLASLSDSNALGDRPNKSDLFDLTIVKYFTYFVFSLRVYETLVSAKDFKKYFLFFNMSYEQFKWLGFIISALVYFGLVLVLLNKKQLKGMVWHVLRLGFWLIGLRSSLAVFVIVMIHGIEYSTVAYKIDSRSTRRQTGILFNFLFGIIILGLLISYLSLLNPNGELKQQLEHDFPFVNALIAAITLVHYVFDGFAFKLRDIYARKTLLRLIR